MKSLAAENESFGLETTLSARTYARFAERLKREQGYFLEMVFVYLPTWQMAMQCVRRRKSLGGHFIEPEVVERRYHAGLRNFFRVYLPLMDRWQFVDNHIDGSPRLVAESIGAGKVAIRDRELWTKLKDQYDG